MGLKLEKQLSDQTLIKEDTKKVYFWGPVLNPILKTPMKIEIIVSPLILMEPQSFKAHNFINLSLTENPISHKVSIDTIR